MVGSDFWWVTLIWFRYMNNHTQARNDPQNFQKESLYATEEIEHTEYNMQPLFMDKKTKKEDSYQN